MPSQLSYRLVVTLLAALFAVGAGHAAHGPLAAAPLHHHGGGVGAPSESHTPSSHTPGSCATLCSAPQSPGGPRWAARTLWRRIKRFLARVTLRPAAARHRAQGRLLSTASVR